MTWQQRKNTYYKLNTKLSYLSNADILKLISEGTKLGDNTVIDLSVPIFCKKLIITKLEHDNLFSTANLYNLPTYYNYGVGSSGFNCFRELLMHIKTTNWVLDDQIENFPLLYHYRIVRTENGEKQDIDYNVEYWNSEAVGTYIDARNKAKYCVILFIEYIPIEVFGWLDTNYEKNKLYISSIIKIVSFLRKNNIIHFDAHLRNIVTDGKIMYLTDFGLVYDEKFEIGNKEFYNNNRYYDYAQVIYGLRRGLLSISTEKNTQVWDTMIANVDRMKLDERYVALLKKYKPIITIFGHFINDIRRDKNTIFPNELVKTEIKKLISK